MCYDTLSVSTSIHILSDRLDDERRGDLIYRGGLLIFKDVPPLREVSLLAEELIGDLVGA